MISASIPSASEPAKDLILVHTVQLKPMIKAQISGRNCLKMSIKIIFIIIIHGTDRHPDRKEINFRLQIQGNRSSSLVSVLFIEFSHPYSSVFQLLVNVFCVTSFCTY